MRRHAFTIIELLVVIGVVALLLGLVLPPLARSLSVTRRTVSLSNLRQLHAGVAMYSQDADGLFPAIDEGVLYPQGWGLRASFTYWQVAEAWPALIYAYLPIDEHTPVFRSPSATGGETGIGGASYVYSTSLVGDPSLWSVPPHAGSLAPLRRAQRQAGVLSPARKAMLWDAEALFLGRPARVRGPDIAEPVPLLMVDGSASNRTPADAAPAVPNPLPNPHASDRLHNTPDGVRGADFSGP